MRIKFIKEEDFVNFKLPSMFIGTISCDFKCCREANIDFSICQNFPWFSEPCKELDNNKIIERYLSNEITKSIVFGGLEPLLQFEELCDFIRTLRKDYCCDDAVVIYTGYKEQEIQNQVKFLSQWKNIIIKFGRYIPNSVAVRDEILGVTLASNNQYAKIIS